MRSSERPSHASRNAARASRIFGGYPLLNPLFHALLSSLLPSLASSSLHCRRCQPVLRERFACSVLSARCQRRNYSLVHGLMLGCQIWWLGSNDGLIRSWVNGGHVARCIVPDQEHTFAITERRRFHFRNARRKKFTPSRSTNTHFCDAYLTGDSCPGASRKHYGFTSLPTASSGSFSPAAEVVLSLAVMFRVANKQRYRGAIRLTTIK